MKIYLATTTIDDVIKQNGFYYLISFHYFKNKIEILKELKSDKNIFIDSGAFSAYNSGAIIDIDDYSKYLIELSPNLYAGLDVIGDPIKTLQNNKYMEQKYKLSPIPTFHMGEDIKHLDRFLNYPYIALGGMVMAENIIPWLDKVWNHILKRDYEIKIHGFGMTNQVIIDRYPWYSIDSTSFDRAARFGIVTLFNDLKNEIYTIHLNEWRRQQMDKGISIELLNDGKYIREQTVKIGINTFWTYQQKINNTKKDFSYLISQKTLFDENYSFDFMREDEV